MGVNKRILKYAEEHFNGMLHTTLNPGGPGVVRIHLLPPAIVNGEFGDSVAIINGQDIIPVSPSWAILLSEFINAVNEYSGRELSEENLAEVMKKTSKGIRKVFPLLPSRYIKKDVYRITNAFKQIAYGEIPDEEVVYLNIGEYAPYMKAPHRMDLMVSAMTHEGRWNCNQKCVHCYAAGQVRAEEKELTTEEWKRVIDKCKEVNIPQLTFTGGEPTIREDLPELIEYASWFVTRLNTNGILLTKELCKRLKEVSLDSMQITFYSEDASIHNKLVGAPRYEETLAGIKNAIEAEIGVSINTPLCTLNRDYVKTLEFLRDLGILYVTCSSLITTGNAETEDSEALQLSTSELKEILCEAVEYCNANGMEIAFTSPGWIQADFCTELGIKAPACGACLSNMAITPAGNVVPCQSWLSGEVLGNFLEDDWESIWNSKECKSRREYSAQLIGKCPLRKVSDLEAKGGC